MSSDFVRAPNCSLNFRSACKYGPCTLEYLRINFSSARLLTFEIFIFFAARQNMVVLACSPVFAYAVLLSDDNLTVAWKLYFCLFFKSSRSCLITF